MGGRQRVEFKGNRRAIWPIRINAALLVIAVAPLIFGLCSNIVTGGSFAAALKEQNLWVYPFLVASGVIYIMYNYKEAEKTTSRPIQMSPEKLGEHIKDLPSVVRQALETASDSFKRNDDFDHRQEQASFNEPPETLQGLIEDLFAPAVDQIRPATAAAAWRLAALMSSINVRSALEGMKLSEDQLRQPRLNWLVRPGHGSTGSDAPLNVVQGRIGYLIRKTGTKYLPPPPLAVDPFIAVALIVVREHSDAYHNECLFEPHDNDADILSQLYYARRSGANANEVNRAGKLPEPDLSELKYAELGKLIHLNLAHTNSRLAARQSELVSHVMRHFLDDELSAVLFDALSPVNQARLAKKMLIASQWMSPTGWRNWAGKGHDLAYAPKLEAASNLSFTGAAGLVIGIISMGCWQIVAWISYGWSWYFGSSHFLITWHGWLKAFLLIFAIAICAVALIRFYPLGVTVAVAGGIGLVMSVLTSPVVRVHTWTASWGTASTIVICALVAAALLAWLGVLYSDRRNAKRPVQLGSFARGSSSRTVLRSRFRPDHDPGHHEW